jgi:hypothetical protein
MRRIWRRHSFDGRHQTDSEYSTTSILIRLLPGATESLGERRATPLYESSHTNNQNAVSAIGKGDNVTPAAPPGRPVPDGGIRGEFSQMGQCATTIHAWHHTIRLSPGPQ